MWKGWSHDALLVDFVTNCFSHSCINHVPVHMTNEKDIGRPKIHLHDRQLRGIHGSAKMQTDVGTYILRFEYNTSDLDITNQIERPCP